MMLKVSLVFIGLFVAAALAAPDCNIDQCARPLKLYDELNCKAIFGTNTCCPKRFDCPDFKKIDENKCHFGGREYSIGEILPRNFTDDSKCVETCFCSRYENEPAKFSCSNSECGVSSIKVSGCINIYGDLNECCSTSTICDDSEKDSLATCWVDREYHEGEKFIPESSPCHECLCHKDFDNSTIVKNPHCREINCEIELKYKSFIQRGCLPVFQANKCCPVDWECPKSGKKVIKRATDDASTENVFVVTPAKSSEYTPIEQVDVKIIFDSDILQTVPTILPETVAEVKEVSKELPNIVSPLNIDPFILPNDLITSVTSEESTTQLIPTEETTLPIISISEIFTTQLAIESSTVTESSTVPVTESSTSSATVAESSQAPTTQQESSTEVLRELVESSTSFLSSTQEESSTEQAISSTQAATEPATISITTEISTTASLKNSSESEESDETNLFGEDSEESSDSESKEETVLPSSTTQVTTQQVSTVAESTTERLFEQVILSEPETTSFVAETQSTTIVPESSSILSESSSVVPESSSVVPESTTIQELSSTEISFQTTESIPLSSSESIPLPSSEAPIISLVPSEIPQVEETSQASLTTLSLPESSPTQVEKLIERLEELIASSQEPTTSVPSTTPAEISQSEQKTEFVNFTVSVSQNDEAVKSLSKRSIHDVDLIPQYYKHSTTSDKGCTFNGRFYKTGEVIKTDNECLKCHCDYAPIGHCLLKDKCNI